MASWIFQANPDEFDLDGYLSEFRDISWTVRQKHFASELEVGDEVYLWRAKGKGRESSGIVAKALVSGPVELSVEHGEARKYWRSKPNGSALRVPLKVIRVANAKQVVKREWLLNDPVLHNLRILKLASETNYRVPDSHAHRLDALWTNTGKDWSRADSIAGLWLYAQVKDAPISKTAESATARMAVLIGRAVDAVYNKVMNYRSIDPDDSRAGLAASGDMARQVWDEFYDAKAKKLRVTELQKEFDRLWRDKAAGAGGEREDGAGSQDDWCLVLAAARKAKVHNVQFNSPIHKRPYQVEKLDAAWFVVERLNGGSPVTITPHRVDAAIQKLKDNGGSVERRSLSYTVAEEAAIVFLHPRLSWSEDMKFILLGKAKAPGTYAGFGTPPEDDPDELQKFARRVRKGQPKFRKHLLMAY